ncbi:unnamed protein product [Chrysoparadoxa australica]
MKAIVCGAVDGLLTSFAIVSGAAGGGFGPSVILVLGIAVAVAEALSTGLGEYLGSRARNTYLEQERKHSEWELAHNREGEAYSLVDSYMQRGMAQADAELVVSTMAKYKNVMLDQMMSDELGLPNIRPVSEDNSLLEGLATLLSFGVAALVPLFSYAVLPLMQPGAVASQLFLSSCFLTGAALFACGAVKSLVSARRWFLSGLETLVVGLSCSGVAYEIGEIVRSWMD